MVVLDLDLAHMPRGPDECPTLLSYKIDFFYCGISAQSISWGKCCCSTVVVVELSEQSSILLPSTSMDGHVSCMEYLTFRDTLNKGLGGRDTDTSQREVWLLIYMFKMIWSVWTRRLMKKVYNSRALKVRRTVFKLYTNTSILIMP